MALSQEKKKQMLLSSYDVLAEDFSENKEKVLEILSQMSSIDSSLSLKMWHSLVQKNEDALEVDKTHYGLRSDLLANVLKEFDEGVKNIEEELISDKYMITQLFGKSSMYISYLCNLVANQIKLGNIETANNMIGIYFENTVGQNDTSFGEFICQIIDDYLLTSKDFGSCCYSSYSTKEYPSEVQDLFYSWVNKITDRKEQAKMNISLIKIC